MTESTSVRERVEAIRDVVAYRPLTTAAIVGLSLVVGALEGVGLGFIVPIVTVVQDGVPTDPAEPVRLFVDLYTVLGLPFTLEFIVLGVGVVIGVRYALTFVASWLTVVLHAHYRRDLRLRGYDRALEAGVAYFDERGSDELLNAILTQTDRASGTIIRLVRILVTSLVCAAYVIVALYVAPMLTLLTGAVLGGFMVASRYVFESGYDVGDRLAESNERVQEAVQTGLQGIRDVKLFRLGREFRADFRGAVDRQTRASVVRNRNQAAIGNVNRFASAATVFALVYVGASVSSLSLPSLGVFLFAMFRLGPQLSSLNSLLYGVDNDLPHLVRTQSFIERLEANREAGGDAPVPDSIDPIAFEDVSFAYRTGDGGVLHGVSFAVDRGEFVGIVGPSGSGKSTLVSLLAGFYEPTKGRILADGTPIHAFDLADWRSRIAVVRQDPAVFNETLRYNLTIGNRTASEAEIEAACATAQVTEFIDELPAGYGTVVGDDGVRLSGGQRQRVAIARALLTDADVLVLDEATSELDTHLEDRVHAGIEGLGDEYTVVAIAHRLSTVAGADRIHVMDDGTIVESGDHEALLATDGEYASLYAAQRANAPRRSPGLGE